MKRRIALLSVLTFAMMCIIFAGSAYAATITSVSDGDIVKTGKSLTIEAVTGYSSSRQDYCDIKVYDSENVLLKSETFKYDGTDTKVKTSFIPSKSGSYTITAETYYYTTFDYNGSSSQTRNSSGKKATIDIVAAKTAEIQESRPTVKVKTNGSGKNILTISGLGNKYTVYRATSKDGTYKKLGSTSGTQYTDKNAGQKTYYYKVKGATTFGSTTYYTKYSYKKDINSRITAITTNIKVETDSSDNAVITVTSSPKATGYKYYRATSLNGTYKLLKTTTKSSYIDTSAGEGTYYYKARPYTVIDSNKVVGKYSAAKEFTANLPGKPGKPQIRIDDMHYIDGTLASGRISIFFDAVDNANRYYVYTSTDGGTTFKKITTEYLTAAPSESGWENGWVLSQTAGSTVTYRIAAVNTDFQNGEYEALSNTVTFTSHK